VASRRDEGFNVSDAPAVRPDLLRFFAATPHPASGHLLPSAEKGLFTPAFCFSPARTGINFAPWFNPGTCRCFSGRVSWPDLWIRSPAAAA